MKQTSIILVTDVLIQVFEEETRRQKILNLTTANIPEI
jgi:hypothetical protein